MRHILTLVDGRVAAIAAVLFGVSTLAAVAVRKRGGPAWRLFLALAGTVLIVVMTIANRGIVVSDEGLAYDLTWWSRNWDTLPGLIGGDIGWWLNVALFIPAAVGWTLLTGRPAIVSSVLVAFVLAIETLHATVLSGAGDPTDVVANMLGVALGVGLALAASNGTPAALTDESRSAREPGSSSVGSRLNLSVLGHPAASFENVESFRRSISQSDPLGELLHSVYRRQRWWNHQRPGRVTSDE